MANDGSLLPPPPPPPVPEIRPVNNGLSGYGLDSQVMLTTVLCLLFVAILVFILHLYARYLLGRGFRRPTAFRFEEGETSDQTARGGAGLDPATVAALPTFVYGRGEAAAAAAAAPERACAVCLSMMEEGERARLLPNCKHAFHVPCIDKWLLSHSTCPLCRRNADPAAEKAVGARAPASPPVPQVGASDASSVWVVVDGGRPAAEEGGSTSMLESSQSPLSSLPPRMETGGQWSGREGQRIRMEGLERQFVGPKF